jgi:hypothetical protein
MPIVNEITRSLNNIGNVNIKYVCFGRKGKFSCKNTTDKDTPLLSPDEPSVYYMAVEE